MVLSFGTPSNFFAEGQTLRIKRRKSPDDVIFLQRRSIHLVLYGADNMAVDHLNLIELS